MKLITLILLLLVSFTCHTEDNSSESSGTSFSLFKSKTFVKNPLDLRDPFKRRINKKKGQSQSKNRLEGYYSNQAEGIESKPLESIRIIGVLIGKERRAIAKISNGRFLLNDIYYLKEGMKIGPNGAEVKAILPGGVVLVEKIRNVYDQDEYLETVLPVSSE
jgi:Tfp pilus assembly protein PilP